MKHWWNGNYFCWLVCEITHLFFYFLTLFWGDKKGAPGSTVIFWNTSPACSVTTVLLRLFWAVTYLYWTPADLFAVWGHAKDQHCISRSIFLIVGIKTSALKSVFTHWTKYPPKHLHVLKLQIYHCLYCHLYFPRAPLCLRLPWKSCFI